MKTYTIGRDLSSDIVINDQTDVVSRRHAVLSVGNRGKMTLTDLSSNGTYINGIKMSPNVAVPVTRNDTISFAHVATLDWEMISKPKGWLTWLIIGLCVAVVAALAVLLSTQRWNPFGTGKDPTEIPADSLQVVDSLPVMDSIANDSLNKPAKDTVQPKPAPKKKDKELPQVPAEPEMPTDTTKPAPRPIGV